MTCFSLSTEAQWKDGVTFGQTTRGTSHCSPLRCRPWLPCLSSSWASSSPSSILQKPRPSLALPPSPVWTCLLIPHLSQPSRLRDSGPLCLPEDVAMCLSGPLPGLDRQLQTQCKRGKDFPVPLHNPLLYLPFPHRTSAAGRFQLNQLPPGPGLIQLV